MGDCLQPREVFRQRLRDLAQCRQIKTLAPMIHKCDQRIHFRAASLTTLRVVASQNKKSPHIIILIKHTHALLEECHLFVSRLLIRLTRM